MRCAQDLLGNKTHRFSLQGSVFWMAPEVVKQSGHTSKADIWSVGCLVVEMFTGEHPWAQLTQMQAIFKVSLRKKTLPLLISRSFLTLRLDHQRNQLCHRKFQVQRQSFLPGHLNWIITLVLQPRNYLNIRLSVL